MNVKEQICCDCFVKINAYLQLALLFAPVHGKHTVTCDFFNAFAVIGVHIINAEIVLCAF